MATSSGISGLLSTLNSGATGNSTTGSNSSSSSTGSTSTATNIGNIGNVASGSNQGTLSSSGIGSGLNVNQLVSQLMSVAQAPITQLNSQISTQKSTISAYGQLSAAVSSFQTTLGGLTDPTQYKSYTATPSNTSVLSASASSSATAGTYTIGVTQLAQAQTLVAAGQSSITSAIGSGTSTTLSFQFGTVSTSGSTTSFSQDSSVGGGSVTISSSNNTLQGIASAINAANVGVSATIVNDGGTSPWRLALTSAKPGSNSNMKITVSGDATLASLLGQDPAGTQNMTQTQAAQSAALTVNGLAISSSTNTITTAIPGVTLNLSSTTTSSTTTGSSTTTSSTPISLVVAQNTSGIASQVQSFVSAYNTMDNTIAQLTAAGSSTTSAGALAGQFTAQQVQNQMRSMLGSSMVGPDGSSVSLTDIGITFQKDGTLSLNSSTLNSVIASNPAKVGAVFAQNSASSDNLVSVVSVGSTAAAGKYAVNVTQLATQGVLTAGSAVTVPYTVTSGSNDTLSVSIDGVATSVTIPSGTYSTADSLASAYQAAINGSSTLTAAGKSVSVSADSDGLFSFTSSSYGSSSFVSLGGTASTGVLGSNSVFTEGKDVEGTIDGFVATGSGQTLTAAAGSPANGMIVKIQGTSTGSRGTISVSQGFANTLNTLANSFTSTTGLITGATNTLNSEITGENASISRLNSQLSLLQASYQAQFTALDTMISSLNNTQNYLTQQLTSLSNTTAYIYGSSSG
jgi:flagellar hook-associated protein 2